MNSRSKVNGSSNKQEFISIIVPVFNEEDVITESIARIQKVLSSIAYESEIVIVDDGSTDNSTGQILAAGHKNVRIISFAQNKGHMTALRAGLEASNGSLVITIDADLQDAPEYIPEMINMVHSNCQEKSHNPKTCFDIVQTYRDDRSVDSRFKRATASLYYLLIYKMTGIKLKAHAADFRLMTRQVVETLISLPEEKLVFRLLIPTLGFQIKYFPIRRDKRHAGKTKYTKRKMLGLFIDSILGFTFRPLRLMVVFGVSFSFILFIGSLITIMISIWGNTLPGWPSLALLILSTNSLLFACVGLVGEYVGRTYQLVQARPRIFWKEDQRTLSNMKMRKTN